MGEQKNTILEAHNIRIENRGIATLDVESLVVYEDEVLSIIGPKRMAYDRNIALVNRVMKMFDEI